jgi:hypothetical protein
MNNFHRELAPISDAAWAQIEEETSRTFKRYLAGRRVVDVQGPGGVALPAIGTGHLRNIEASGDGILARQREVKALVELRVPFDLDRQQIDDVERGSNDSDWQPRRMPRDDWPLPRIRPFSKATPPPASKAFGRGPAIRARPFRPMCANTPTPLPKR